METMRERFTAVTTDLLAEHPRLAVVLADISADSFRPAATRYPDRVINVGIREQLLISVAGGLSLAGMRPIAHTFASFLVERPFEQIKLDLNHQAADGRRGTGQRGRVLRLLRQRPHPSVAGRRGAAGHAARLDRARPRASRRGRAPDPRGGPRGRAGLRAAVHRGQRGPAGRRAGPADHAAPRRSRGTVLAVGPLADAVVDATLGFDVTVLYAATIRPLDVATLRDSLQAPDVVLVEPYLAGTSVPAVAEALRDLPHRILGLGVGRRELRRYGTPAEHQAAHGLDARSLRAEIASFLRRPRFPVTRRAGPRSPAT